MIGGVLLGVLMGSSDHIKAFLTFPVAIGTNTPPTVVVAIFFIVVGIGLKFHMAVLLLGIIPSLTMGVNLVFREFPDELKHKAYMLGNSNFEVIERNFKFSLPKIIENVRAQVGNTIIFLMASEMQLSGEGMGYRIRLHSKIPDMAVVYPYLFLLILLGYLFKLFLKQSIDWVSPWFNLKEEK